MSRYRKVELQMWGDKKFQALSPLPPSGQGLWVYLLTGPSTSLVPGLLPVGRAAMAEELGWPLEAFDEAFGEVFRLGMVQADWKARLVWLPNALRDSNKPENPNVAVAWRTAFDLLPECELKTAAGDAIRTFLAGLGPKYLAAFAGNPGDDGTSLKPSRKASRKPSEKTGEALPEGFPKALPEDYANTGTGTGTVLKDTHSAGAGAREAPPPGRVVPFDTPPDRPPRHCAYHSPHGLDVPHGLHGEFVRKLLAAGATADAANETLFEWYRATEAAWAAAGQVVGDDAYQFWRARWRETHGTTARPVAVQGHPPSPGAWRPTSEDIWGRVLVRLDAHLNRHTFLTWFRDTALLRDGGDTLEVGVPDTHVGDWIHRHYADQVTAALRDVGREGVVLVFVPAADADAAAEVVQA